MSTNDYTPPPQSRSAAAPSEPDDAEVINTIMTLTVEEAQNRWNELITDVIVTGGPVHIASPTGGGAVLISIADYEALQARMNLAQHRESGTEATE